MPSACGAGVGAPARPACEQQQSRPAPSLGRRHLLPAALTACVLSSSPAWANTGAGTASGTPAPVQTSAGAQPQSLVERLRAQTETNREKNNKARLDSYNKRNFRDYFSLEVDDATAAKRGIRPETQAAIRAWLEANK